MAVTRLTLPALLILAALSFHTSAQAEELKDIAQLASQGQQAAALGKLNTYLSDNPKDVQAMFLRGVLLAETGKREDAIKAFTELTERYPSLPEPYNNLAVLYADQGQYEKARKALESAIKTHPSYATAHENLGDIYARMASEAYDKALQLDNGNFRAQNKLSLIRDIFGSGNTTSRPIVAASRGPDIFKSPTPPTLKAPAAPLPNTKPAEPVKQDEQKPVEIAKPAPVEPVKAAPPAVTAPTPSEPADSSDKGVRDAVDQWAKAWSDKNVSKYLSSYGDNFQVPNGENRQSWENTRKERINKPANINVEVSNLRIKMESSTKARASFSQSYRADSMVRRTSKTLVMEKVKGNWVITQELTDR